MNIFALDRDPVTAAQLQCDRHVVKMVLETAQMLSGVHRSLETPQSDSMYRLTHKNHPCSVWARSAASNYDWLVDHGIALCDEYTYRYDRTHKSRAVIELCRDHRPDLPAGRSEFALAMPEKFKTESAVDSYRRYYAAKRHDFDMRWTRRDIPQFFLDFCIDD